MADLTEHGFKYIPFKIPDTGGILEDRPNCMPFIHKVPGNTVQWKANKGKITKLDFFHGVCFSFMP